MADDGGSGVAVGNGAGDALADALGDGDGSPFFACAPWTAAIEMATASAEMATGRERFFTMALSGDYA
jgi:H+/gluconate symporter-like permease